MVGARISVERLSNESVANICLTQSFADLISDCAETAFLEARALCHSVTLWSFVSAEKLCLLIIALFRIFSLRTSKEIYETRRQDRRYQHGAFAEDVLVVYSLRRQTKSIR